MTTERPLESGIRRDLREDLTYSDYLRLDLLLSAQQPLSRHHDELLFIIQHQTSELWIRLLIHELESACRNLAADRMNGALKDLARVKHIQRQLFEQWAVLETLTPSEYADFRDLLAQASGFQSLQYRILEFRLGNKTPDMLEVFEHAPEDQARLREALEVPSLYDEVLRLLARRGFAIPPERAERDWSQPMEPDPRLVEAFKAIYEAREANCGRLRAVRGARGHRGELPALALPPPEDGGADHRREEGHGRIVGHRVPAGGAGPALLPGAVGRADGDRALRRAIHAMKSIDWLDEVERELE